MEIVSGPCSSIVKMYSFVLLELFCLVSYDHHHIGPVVGLAAGAVHGGKEVVPSPVLVVTGLLGQLVAGLSTLGLQSRHDRDGQAVQSLVEA